MARRNILPVFVPHEGCPHACVFCDQRRISGCDTPVSGADVAARIESARRAGLPAGAELAFYGGSFTAIPAERQEELLSAVRPWRDSGVIRCIRLSTRPDAVDREVLRRLKRHGVETVELGAQSMDERVLRLSGRGHSAAETERAARLVRAAGLSLVLQMMTGLPGADESSDVETARRVAALEPDGVRIYPTVIVRGTALERMWRAGAYDEHTVDDAVRVCARIVPIFEENGIPVIRLGLNPTPALSGGEAVAGAYHPALGELVRSELMCRRAAALLRGVPPGASVRLLVPPGDVGVMIGQHRKNIETLRTRFSLAELRVEAALGTSAPVGAGAPHDGGLVEREKYDIMVI